MSQDRVAAAVAEARALAAEAVRRGLAAARAEQDRTRAKSVGEPAQVVSFRIDPDMLAELRDIANQQGCTVSDLMRRGALMALEEPNRMVITWTSPPVVSLEPAECLEGAIGMLDTDPHGGCPCRKTGVHRFHRCEHGTEWWQNSPTEDASGPADPSEGDGTGAGEREAQNGSQGAMDAAIEAAARALFDAIRLDYEPQWDQAGAKTRQQCFELGEAAVRAAEPILRQAVAEEIAQRISDVCECAGETDPAIVADCEYRKAAEIAREVGRG